MEVNVLKRVVALRKKTGDKSLQQGKTQSDFLAIFVRAIFWDERMIRFVRSHGDEYKVLRLRKNDTFEAWWCDSRCQTVLKTDLAMERTTSEGCF